MIRVFDILIAFCGLVVLMPFIIIVLLIGLFDSAKPLFIQKRVGKNQRTFYLYKFRTMVLNTKSVGTHEVDPMSITKFGHFLRKSKIDELPQLFNVLKGEMSLVGPRPCLPNQTDVINAREEKDVFKVRPGITGLAQLREIDMSTPGLLAETDQQMIESINLIKYFNYILKTIIGGGRGDRIKSELETSNLSIFRYTTKAYISRILILSVDLLLAFISIHIASILRHNFDFKSSLFVFAPTVLLVILVRVISFRWFRTYAVIVRFAGISDILQVFLAVTGGSIFLVGLAIILRPYGLNIAISVLLIDYFLLLTSMAALRLMMPSLFQIFFGKKIATTNILIIGAGQLGAITRNVLRQDPESGYHIVGILDDNRALQNKSLDGIPIYKPEQLPEILQEDEIDKAVFAVQNISSKRKNEIVDLCLAHNVKLLQVPFNASWISDDFQIDQLKEIQIEDLLNRPVIAIDEENVSTQYRDKVVMITGGAGSIGSEITRQVIKYKPKSIIIVDQAETPLVNIELECREEFDYDNIVSVITDVNDIPRLLQVFETYRPEIIFHAAAYKHVPIMEAYPREALQVNVGGTMTIARLAERFAVEKFVMVSTDKAVNPTNVMGASKRIAEIFIQTLNTSSSTRFITTRFGNVLGSNGSVVPRFKKQIAKGGPITVTHKDITRYFMTIPEASQLVLEAGAMGSGGEIFLFDMGEPVKIADLAIKMIQLSGLQPNKDIDVVYTGLRPGEKLYEELLSTKENSIETHHPKITKAKVRPYNFAKIEKTISDMISALDIEDEMALVSRMKDIVPEYQSSNSVFNKLDDQDSEVIQSSKKPVVDVR